MSQRAFRGDASFFCSAKSWKTRARNFLRCAALNLFMILFTFVDIYRGFPIRREARVSLELQSVRSTDSMTYASPSL